MSENASTTTRLRTVRLRTRKHKDIQPGEIIVYLKEWEIEVKCLQKEGMDYLLTIENPRHKLELLENGSITVSQKQINIEDPDWKITYSNLFGAPY